jgi:hypothetical protein
LPQVPPTQQQVNQTSHKVELGLKTTVLDLSNSSINTVLCQFYVFFGCVDAIGSEIGFEFHILYWLYVNRDKKELT